jgi:hypothetical protein
LAYITKQARSNVDGFCSIGLYLKGLIVMQTSRTLILECPICKVILSDPAVLREHRLIAHKKSYANISTNGLNSVYRLTKQYYH